MITRELSIATAFLAAVSTYASAADLTPAQQKLLADAQSSMAQVQSNLKQAQETSAGKPSASRAQLAFTRIDSTNQSIGQVRARLVELPTDHPDVQSIQKQLDAAVEALEDLETHLTGKKPDKPQEVVSKESIIAANELPPDRYKGPDRDQLAKIATDAWLKIQPDTKVLAIRIPSQDWKQEVPSPHQTESPQKTDRSKLQVQLIIAHDDKLAVIRPIDLWKNHLEKDAITASPLHDKATQLSPQDFVFLTKVK